MIRKMIIGIVILALLVGAYIGYTFFRTPEEASGPIEAVPLALEENTQDGQTESADSKTEASTVDTTTEDTNESENSAESNSETEAADSEADASTTDAGDESAAIPLAVFEIVQAESQARFYIDEVLRGDPVTVEGITDQLAGQIAVDPGDLSSAQIGTILVNARTLATDNDFRNRAIKNQILLTDDHEFVTFEPTEIIGLPESGTVGESYTFQIAGDLTIIGSIQQVTFEATVTPTAEQRLEGIATTTILYADFGVTIPASQSVDAVEDDLRLEIDFVAEVIQE
ncbi:MAG: YceI family protein [Chloroflexota bacterium]